jgi:hypothetical protein
MISNILIITIVAFLGAIAYLAWQRSAEAAKAFEEEQQKVAWFKIDFINYTGKYPNTTILFPKLVQIPGGYRVEEGRGQNNQWWTLDGWFTEQHEYVKHVAHHTSHKMSGEHNGVKTYVNSVYELRRIKPDQKTKKIQ